VSSNPIFITLPSSSPILTAYYKGARCTDKRVPVRALWRAFHLRSNQRARTAVEVLATLAATSSLTSSTLLQHSIVPHLRPFCKVTMGRLVTLATCSLNQWALDFESNTDHIIQAYQKNQSR